jgi:hypothetical protein
MSWWARVNRPACGLLTGAERVRLSEGAMTKRVRASLRGFL